MELVEAAASGRQEIVVAGADVMHRDRDDWTALHYAAYNGHLEMARLVMRKPSLETRPFVTRSWSFYATLQMQTSTQIETACRLFIGRLGRVMTASLRRCWHGEQTPLLYVETEPRHCTERL